MSSFCVKVIFSEIIWARAIKLESCIHLEELNPIISSILSLELICNGSLTNVEFLRLGHFFRNYKG